MYELSRELFRSLRGGLLTDPRHPNRNTRALLTLCEETVTRVAMHPAGALLQSRRLFTRVRFMFPVARQAELLDAIEREVMRMVRELTAGGVEGRRGMLRCAATTRRGHPCDREPLLGRTYCPSHKHLEDPVKVGASRGDVPLVLR